MDCHRLSEHVSEMSRGVAALAHEVGRTRRAARTCLATLHDGGEALRLTVAGPVTGGLLRRPRRRDQHKLESEPRRAERRAVAGAIDDSWTPTTAANAWFGGLGVDIESLRARRRPFVLVCNRLDGKATAPGRSARSRGLRAAP
jgi:hypothetical protein